MLSFSIITAPFYSPKSRRESLKLKFSEPNDLCASGMSQIPSLSGGINLWGESPLCVNSVNG